jgi:hypothetical protein
MAKKSRIPRFLHGYALDNNGDAGEESDDGRCRQESPYEPLLSRVPHDTEQEDADGTLAHANDHESGDLAEDFVHDCRPIDLGITDISKVLSEAVPCRNGDEDGIDDLQNLEDLYVSLRFLSFDILLSKPTNAIPIR